MIWVLVRHRINWVDHTDNHPPARKAARAVTSATYYDAQRRTTMHDESSPVSTLTAESVAQYRTPPAPMMGSLPSGWWHPSLPASMSLPLPHFATQADAPDATQSLPVEIRPCPPSPGTRASTHCFDLAEFDSECSRTAMSSSPGSDVVPVAPVNLLSETIWFVTPSSQLSPAPEEDRGVVASPELGSDIMSRFLHLRTVWTRWWSSHQRTTTRQWLP